VSHEELFTGQSNEERPKKNDKTASGAGGAGRDGEIHGIFAGLLPRRQTPWVAAMLSLVMAAALLPIGINQSINTPTSTRHIEERASERRSGFSLDFFASCAWTRGDLAFEVGLAGCYHATHGVVLEMFPHQFIRVTIRRVSRKIIQLEP
jgi:hypothetical protein